MDFILGITLIISMILGVIIVNKGYRLFMKILGTDFMLYSIRTKIAVYILVGGLIWFVFLGVIFIL